MGPRLVAPSAHRLKLRPQRISGAVLLHIFHCIPCSAAGCHRVSKMMHQSANLVLTTYLTYLPNKITEKLHMDACQPIPTLRFLKQCAQTDFAPLEFVQDPVTMAAGSLAPSSSRKRIKYRRLRTCGNPKVSLLSSKLGRATAMV